MEHISAVHFMPSAKGQPHLDRKIHSPYAAAQFLLTYKRANPIVYTCRISKRLLINIMLS